MEYLEQFGEFLRHKRGSGDRTVRAYLRDVQIALDEIGVFEIANIERYLIELAAKNSARSTIARRLSALRAYGAYLSEELHARKDNPAQRVSPPRQGAHIASDGHMRKRDRALREMAKVSGLTADKLVTINIEDVDWQSGVLHLMEDGSRVPLGRAQGWLRIYIGSRSRGPVFLSPTGGRLSARLAGSVLSGHQG